MIILAKSQFNWFSAFCQEDFQGFNQSEHVIGPGSHVEFLIYTKKHKSGRGPSNEHLWQVWLKSVQRFQRRRFKCEKLMDGRWMLTHDKSSHGLWPGELKTKKL